MANYCLPEPEEAKAKMREIVSATTEMRDTMVSLFNDLKSFGNEIGGGLADFVPRLEEMVPICTGLVEAAEESQKTLSKLIEQVETVNSIGKTSLD